MTASVLYPHDYAISKLVASISFTEWQWRRWMQMESLDNTVSREPQSTYCTNRVIVLIYIYIYIYINCISHAWGSQLDLCVVSFKLFSSIKSWETIVLHQCHKDKLSYIYFIALGYNVILILLVCYWQWICHINMQSVPGKSIPS